MHSAIDVKLFFRSLTCILSLSSATVHAIQTFVEQRGHSPGSQQLYCMQHNSFAMRVLHLYDSIIIEKVVQVAEKMLERSHEVFEVKAGARSLGLGVKFSTFPIASGICTSQGLWTGNSLV